MTAEEFLKQLENCLQNLPKTERESALSYYREYLEEAGDNADKAVESLGSPQSVAENIMKDFSIPEQKPELSAGNIVFSVLILIFTSPFWFTVGILWLTLLFSLGTILLSLAFSAVAAPIQGVSYLMHGLTGNGIWDIGTGLLCAGLVMLLWKPFMMVSIRSTTWLWNQTKCILNALFRKEQAT